MKETEGRQKVQAEDKRALAKIKEVVQRIAEKHGCSFSVPDPQPGSRFPVVEFSRQLLRTRKRSGQSFPERVVIRRREVNLWMADRPDELEKQLDWRDLE